MQVKLEKFDIKFKLDLLRIFNSARLGGYFYRKKKVRLSDHNRFIREKVLSKILKIYLGFIKKKNKPFGYIRFDRLKKKNWFEISIAIYPKFYGKHLGTEMMRLALKNFNKSNNKIIVAIVKKNNPRSLKCFLKNGFKVLKVKNKKKYTSVNPVDFKKEYYLYLNKRKINQ